MIEAAISLAATKLGLSAAILLALCSVESDFRNLVTVDSNNKISVGVCQVQLATAEFVAQKTTINQLLDPEYNATIAAMYLKWQLFRYQGNLLKAISAYNAGTATPKNKAYVQHFLERLEKYESRE